MKSSLEAAISNLIQSLPSSEECTSELIAAASRNLSDAEVLEIIHRDSGLTANLMRLANSPCYRQGKSKPITTTEEALDMLGVEPLVMLVGASYVTNKMRPHGVSDQQWMDYEQHGHEISQVCTVLAELLDLGEEQQKMYTVAGLTHDIGRAVIMIAANSASSELMGTTPDKMARLVHDEKAALGMNHCEIGEKLFSNWRFSKIHQEGIARHHTPLVKDDFSFPGSLIFISHFVTMNDFTGETICRMIPDELLENLGVTRELIDHARDILLPSFN